VVWALDGKPSADRGIIDRAYSRIGALDDDDAAAVITALDRLGAQHAADEACDRAITQADDLASRYGLDRDRLLRNLFTATARRRV